WEGLGNTSFVYEEKWPSYDSAAMVKDSVEVVIQINGKVREKLEVATGLSKEEFEKTCMNEEKVKALLADKDILKVIAVPGKLLNVVVKG
ncbi:MAG: leucine--tRNA ligase, partial [Bacillota bacterium]|nr:leucine--tRNA ligase [Bacillota bacterium]